MFVCLPTSFGKSLCDYCLPLMAERYTYCNSNSGESFDCIDQQSSKVPEKYKHTAISSCYTYTSNNSTHERHVTLTSFPSFGHEFVQTFCPSSRTSGLEMRLYFDLVHYLI